MAPTYLRVKRPRHVAPLPYLRVEGLLGEGSKRTRPNTVDNLACLLHQSTYIAQQQQTPAASAVWKRVQLDSTDAGSSKRRFVDAVLDVVDDEEGPSTKRRRLALTLVRDAPSAPVAAAVVVVPKKNAILDPVSRLVQESLQSVLNRECTVLHHLEMLSTDSRFSNQTRRWLQFSGTAGNILHISALLNNVEGASAVVAWEIPSLLEAVDADGQTPYQLAVAIGHSQVAQVLQVDIRNEEDYVYDVFLFDKEMADNGEKDTPTSVELRGGIGYWDEHGELILEAMDDENVEDSDNDEDDDSNREDYEGNDYPDEEEEEGWEEEDDSVEEQVDFRHRPVYMFGQDVQVNTKPTVESDDEEYDAQYGLYEPRVPLREYAYDPDRESD
jgi:hypothetical protein